MLTISLAGHPLRIQNQYPAMERLCRPYAIPPEEGREAELFSATPEEIRAEEIEECPMSPGSLETLALYRKICEKLVEEDIVLFHSSALMIHGQAILLTGPSGAGKSTHARLWRQRFGTAVTMINDDKPLLEVKKTGITVFGTPYAGKEGLQTNCSAPVKAIVLIVQAPENGIRRLTLQEAYPYLLDQTYRSRDKNRLRRTLELTASLAELPVYRLCCTISQEAVELVYCAVFGEKPR